jgi:hypothetical protein
VFICRSLDPICHIAKSSERRELDLARVTGFDVIAYIKQNHKGNSHVKLTNSFGNGIGL